MNTFGIHWAALSYLPIVGLLLSIAILAKLYWVWSVKNVIAILTRSRLGRQFLHNASLIRYIGKAILWVIGFTALTLALLRPQWDKKEEIIAQEGRDLFIALDISRSMLAQDMEPNRLAFAKQKIKRLVKTLSCERVGLILFSGSSFISCPLTADYGAFFMFLDQIDVETISSGTTALDKALDQALQAFQHMPQRKHKLVVICTDGEDFSLSLESVKNRAHDQGLTVCALGIGTEHGAPIPVYDQAGTPRGHQKDKEGNVVISTLNAPLLQSLSKDLGGLYIYATPDDIDIKTLIAYVQRFDKERLEDKKISTFQEQYPWFVLISFIALLLEWLL